MNYNFSSINDKDLEDLTRDLLSKEWSTHLQSFKKGRDKGIDLRYSTIDDENEIIIQVKHYSGSKYANLKSDLKNKELPKVQKLNPKKYIVVTSLKLGVNEKDEIKKILSPYILSTNDIYGQDELNGLISKFPKIEEAHFKLWLSSTTVLNRILHNGLKGRSEFVSSKIESRIKKFVPSKSHKKSVKILNDTNFILITGAPGIGKTILANILTYQLLAEDFELVYINEIRDAEVAYESNKKQIFYFDDFLGATTLDLTSSKNADSTLINFIERVKLDNKKRLILTCRTTILNQAKEKSEIIYNSKIDINNHEVKIEDYGKLEKAKILYNHIYDSNLTNELKSTFFKDYFHWEIINHRSYNPRIIEFFTDIDRLQENVEYKSEIINFLDNPDKIWEKSFTNQLSDNAQILLSTLFSLSGTYVVSETKLKEAFDNRVNFEILNNNFRRRGNLYKKTIKELQNAFIHRIITRHSEHYQSIDIRFLNPSIEDFLYYYFNNDNIDEYFIILKSSKYLEQFKRKITTKKENYVKKIYFDDSNYNRLLELFIDKYPCLDSYSSNKDLDVINCLINLFNWKDIEKKVISIFNKLTIENLNWEDKYNLIEILEYFAKNQLTELIPIPLNKLFVKITEGYLSIHLFTAIIPNLLKHNVYENTINKMKQNDFNSFKEYKNNIINYWEQNIEKYIETSNITTAMTKNDIDKIAKERIKELTKLTEQLQVRNFITLRKFKFNSEKQLSNNIEAKRAQKVGIENIKKKDSISDEINAINRLFEYDIETKRNDLPF
ncbi:restriction endonuclease [Cellulophaga baltica]|uniref:nSTAND3 domain-containing NTPase n=1 Tax=Cellulophaga baltica TaxID=76594 RepID=UPI000425E900|nr:restriction endonuclease [Cellulophaga baltica]